MLKLREFSLWCAAALVPFAVVAQDKEKPAEPQADTADALIVVAEAEPAPKASGDAQTRDARAQLEAMKKAQFQKRLAQMETGLKQREENLKQLQTKLDTLETRLDEQASQLDKRAKRLEKREADLKKSREALAEEKQAFMATVREQKADAARAEAKLKKKLEDPEALAATVVDRQLSAEVLAEQKAALLKSLKAEQGDYSGVLQRRIELELKKALDEAQVLFSPEALKKAYTSHYLESFSPEELLKLAEFFDSTAGQKLMAMTQDPKQSPMLKLYAKAAELQRSFDKKVTQITSNNAISEMIRSNLRQIVVAGTAYLQATGEDSVTLAKLVSSGYIGSVPPIHGENYRRLRIESTGGVLQVMTSDDQRVAIQY